MPWPLTQDDNLSLYRKRVALCLSFYTKTLHARSYMSYTKYDASTVMLPETNLIICSNLAVLMYILLWNTLYITEKEYEMSTMPTRTTTNQL